MSQRGHERHLTELQLAQALLPGAAQPSCPVAGCTACAARLEEARATAARFHEEVLPRTLAKVSDKVSDVREADGAATAATAAAAPVSAAESPKRLAPRAIFPTMRASLLRPPVLGALAAAAAAVVLWVKWPRPTPLLVDDERGDRGDAGGPVGPDDAYVGLKGDDAVRAYLRRAGEISPLVDGDDVQPGDAIRFLVDARRGHHVLVVSVDGAQQVSVYFPFGGDGSQELAQGAEQELPGAVELDATLGDERIWILMSRAPIAVATIRPALDRIAAGGAAAVVAATAKDLTAGAPLASGVHVETMLLHKRAAKPD